MKADLALMFVEMESLIIGDYINREKWVWWGCRVRGKDWRKLTVQPAARRMSSWVSSSTWGYRLLNGGDKEPLVFTGRRAIHLIQTMDVFQTQLERWECWNRNRDRLALPCVYYSRWDLRSDSDWESSSLRGKQIVEQRHWAWKYLAAAKVGSYPASCGERRHLCAQAEEQRQVGAEALTAKQVKVQSLVENQVRHTERSRDWCAAMFP